MAHRALPGVAFSTLAASTIAAASCAAVGVDVTSSAGGTGGTGTTSTISTTTSAASTGSTGGSGGTSDAGDDAGLTDAPDGGLPPVCVIAAGGGVDPLMVPRLVAPLSTSTVTSGQPKMRWKLPLGATGSRVEICATRACTTVAQTFDAMDTIGAPLVQLPAGVWFWRVHAMTGTFVDPATSAVWEMVVRNYSSSTQSSNGSMPDFDGDGRGDVVAGARFADTGAGSFYTFLADGLGGFQPPILLSRPACENGQLGTNLGASMASAGDVDGDGYPELIVGAPAGLGGALVYAGGPAGPRSPPVQLGRPAGGPARFGVSVAGIGDIDADGFGDVALGTDDVLGGVATKVYVYKGSVSGLSSSPFQTLTGPSFDDSRFGASLAGADFNGDGYADLAVGARNASGLKTGRVYVYHGATGGLLSAPTTTLVAPEVGGDYGSAIAAGDLNGDGFADLVVGAPGENGGLGRVYVYLGNPFNMGTTPATVLDAPGGTQFGASVAILGDVDGDGLGDLAVISAGSGNVFIFAGTFSGTAGTPFASLAVGTGENAASVAAIGDFDGDTRADLVVGSLPGLCGSGVGSVRAWPASALAGMPLLLQSLAMGDCFGGSLARRAVGRRGWRPL